MPSLWKKLELLIMAQDKKQIKSTYPLPAYNYRVTILKDGEPLVLSLLRYQRI
ncbi:MAG: hypothetical protein U0401_34420 [Anaerolineae bacterium]